MKFISGPLSCTPAPWLIGAILAAGLLSSTSPAHAEFYHVTLHTDEIGSGSSRESACSNAVASQVEWCDESVSYSAGRWYCNFRTVSPAGTVCTPCTGFFCNYAHADIWQTECAEPLVYNPYTGECEEVIEEKNEPDCEESTANPVNYSTGNKSIIETDLAIDGHVGLYFKRHWNSYNRKWLFSFRQYAKIAASSGGNPTVHTVTIYRDTGRAVQFLRLAGAWKADADVKDSLVLDGTLWRYTLSSGDREWFDSAGKLQKIRRADGTGVTLTYPTTSIAQVADDYGNLLSLELDGSGRVTAMTDPAGQRYRYRYKNNGQLEYVSYPDATPGVSGSNPFGEDNPFRRYHYEDADPDLVTGITDENGDRFKTIAYDDQGRAVASGLGDGSIGRSSLDYTSLFDAGDPRVTVTNALGKDTVYHLERQFGVSKVKAIEGIASANCLADVQGREYYPENGWVKRKVNKAGSLSYYEYFTDAARYGLPSKRVEAEGSAEQRTFTFDWDNATRQPTREVLQGQKQTDYTYHPNGRLHTRTETDLTTGTEPYSTNGNTRVWTMAYTYFDPGTDSLVKTMTIDGPRDIADSTVYEYSSRGFLTRETNAVGHITRYQAHNGRGQPERIIDANGKMTDMTYTARGWLASITRDVGAINARTEFAYDDVGQLTRVTLPDDTYFDYEYDEAHQLRAIRNTIGERIEYSLDADGNPDFISFRNASNTATLAVDYQFDELSRLFRRFGSNGQETRYGYNDKGQLESIDDGVNPPTWQEFDALGRVQTVTDPANNPASFSYDSEDRIDSVTDQRGLVTDYIFDGFGNLKQLTSPDTGVTTFTYDESGNRLSKTDARGVLANYTYDALNRLTSIRYPAEPGKNVTYTYDSGPNCTLCKGYVSAITDASGVTSYINDALGRVVSRINAVKLPDGSSTSLVTDFVYNSAGRLSRVKYPGGQLIKFTLDPAGRVLRVKRQDNASSAEVLVANMIKYQPFGPMTEIKYGNNLQLSRSYDLDGRLAIQTIGGKQNLLYDYDPVNNIREIANHLDPSRSELFSYDALGRLNTATGMYGALDYEYDEVGNRISQAIDRDGMFTRETYHYPLNNNRLDRIDIQVGSDPVKQRSFVYDETGNLIDETRADGSHRRAYYDSTNRMERVTP